MAGIPDIVIVIIIVCNNVYLIVIMVVVICPPKEIRRCVIEFCRIIAGRWSFGIIVITAGIGEVVIVIDFG